LGRGFGRKSFKSSRQTAARSRPYQDRYDQTDVPEYQHSAGTLLFEHPSGQGTIFAVRAFTNAKWPMLAFERRFAKVAVCIYEESCSG
jgi:hypothetical protein